MSAFGLRVLYFTYSFVPTLEHPLNIMSPPNVMHSALD